MLYEYLREKYENYIYFCYSKYTNITCIYNTYIYLDYKLYLQNKNKI